MSTPDPLKPGYQTSEFWIVLLLGLCQVVLLFFGAIDKSWAAAGLLITTAIYNVLRATLKAKAMPPPK